MAEVATLALDKAMMLHINIDQGVSLGEPPAMRTSFTQSASIRNAEDEAFEHASKGPDNGQRHAGIDRENKQSG